MSADPINFPDGPNQHFYAPVPTMGVDPWGLAFRDYSAPSSHTYTIFLGVKIDFEVGISALIDDDFANPAQGSPTITDQREHVTGRVTNSFNVGPFRTTATGFVEVTLDNTGTQDVGNGIEELWHRYRVKVRVHVKKFEGTHLDEEYFVELDDYYVDFYAYGEL